MNNEADKKAVLDFAINHNKNNKNNKIWIAAKYLRLSKEDRNKVNRMDNSESIENQDQICDQWLSQHPEVILYDTYIDDGCTGLDYDRADYQRMKNDIDNGPVNMIICKSLVRFGREQIDTLILFKREFVYRDIRFVGVVDNIDYRGSDPKADDGISIPMQCLMNDYYSRRTSLDIRSVVAKKQEKGQFIGSFAKYGYVKDPENKNHLLVDPYAAEVVKRIFSLFLLGNNIKFIVEQLNLEGIPCPTVYKREVQKLNYNCSNKLDTTKYWVYDTVKNILRDPVYTGCVVQHKKEKIAYNIKKFRVIPRSEWKIKPDMHEAIISQEDFDRVQQLIASRTRSINFKNLSPYAGVIVCGDCGRAMSKQQFEGKKGFKYRCGTYARIGKSFCTQHAIYTTQLDGLLLKEIRSIVKQLSDEDLKYIKKSLEKQAPNDMDEKTLSLLLKQKNDLENEKREMLVFLSKHVLSDRDYMVYNEEYERQVCEIDQKILALEHAKAKMSSAASQYAEYVSKFLEYKSVEKVDRELVVNLVEKIYVYEDRVLIKFLFKNPYVQNLSPSSGQNHN